MRKIVLALAAAAAVGLAIPTFAATPAEAHVVVIKKMHRDHGRHYGWYKHRHHRWHHGPRVIVR